MTIFNYTVNYVDLIIVGILLISGIIGQQKGIFITLVNFIRYVLGFSLCIFSTDRLSQPVYDNFLQERVQNTVNEKIVTSSNIDEIMTNINNAVNSLPNYIKNSIDVSSLKLSSNNISQNITNELFEPVIIGILKGIPNFASNQFLKTAADSQLYQLLLNYNPFNVITEGII